MATSHNDCSKLAHGQPDKSTSARRAVHYAVCDGAPRTATKVAVVVGTILNVINQGDALFGTRSIVWWKLLLTYSVPYLVCTYGIVSSRLRHDAQVHARSLMLARENAVGQ